MSALMLKVKELRRGKNQSQTELSAAIGVSLRTIQNYEAGKVDISSKKLELIAQHYNVTVAYLFGGKKEEKEEIKEVKEFKTLNIDAKLDELHNLLQILTQKSKKDPFK